MADTKVEQELTSSGPTNERGRGRGGMGGGGRGRGGFNTANRGGYDGVRGHGAASRPPRGTSHGRRGGPRGGGQDHGFSNGNDNQIDTDDEALFMQQMMEDAEAEKDKEPKKFLGRCRLFVGNLPNNIEESEMEELFKPFGETSEMFLNKPRGFGFIKLDFLHNAQNAKSRLDGTDVKGRTIKIRFASPGASLKIKYLSPTISNEVLEQTFSQFGPVERAVVYVDERGRSLGEGVVEFSRKPSAQMAFRRINEGVFLMTSQPRPVAVETIEGRDEEDGLAEKTLPRNMQLMKDRENPPRFAMPDTFEFEFAQRWKQLYELERQQRDQLQVQISEARDKLHDEEAFAIQEWHAQQLRQELEQRQEDLKRMEEMQTAERERREEEHKRRLEEQQRFRDAESRRHEEMMQREEEMQKLRLERMGGGPGRGARGGPGERVDMYGEPAQEDMQGWSKGGMAQENGSFGDPTSCLKAEAPNESVSQDQPDGENEENGRPLAPADLIKQRSRFDADEEIPQRGGFRGRGFPRGMQGQRRGPDFAFGDAGGREEYVKRPRWN